MKKVHDRELIFEGGNIAGNINNSDIFRPDSDEDPLGSEAAGREKENGKVDPEKDVILDLNPEKYEKPKDHLFFDFFSLYTKNFIGEKKGQANI